MSAQVWIPLIATSGNGEYLNRGLADIRQSNSQATTSDYGKIGKCRQFDGVNDYVQITQLTGMEDWLENDISITFWIRQNDEGSRSIIFSQSGLAGANGYFSIEKGNDGDEDKEGLRIVFSRHSDHLSSSFTLTPLTWIHVAIVKSSDGTVKTYKNGVFVESYTIQETTSGYTGTIYYLGRDSSTGDTCFNGRLNDFRIYDHCLSQKEVKEISRGLALHLTLDNQYTPGIIYDSSGIPNNGITNDITYDTDSPRYSSCSVFNGTSSYIKITGNTWMSQFAHEMTINLWAYHQDWPSVTGGRLFSCTESGGFNLEAGNSGYWRFPVYVATTADQATRAYRYDSKEVKISDLSSGWHMFSFVYTDAGTKTYIDGQLHHTYNYAAPVYGIRFNTNARLFLGCEADTANPKDPYFGGKESDFRIYYTALSADDILELYNTPVSVGRNGSIFASEYVEVAEE